MTRKTTVREVAPLRGIYRLHIVNPDGSIAGDSGWVKNQIVLTGFEGFLCANLAGTTGSQRVTHLALGTGGAPASNATTLTGEVVKRQAITAAVSNTSKTVRFTGTFASANSFVTDTQNISNIGMFNSSSGGSMFSGAALTAGSSSCATNQTVNATYDVIFA